MNASGHIKVLLLVIRNRIIIEIESNFNKFQSYHFSNELMMCRRSSTLTRDTRIIKGVVCAII